MKYFHVRDNSQALIAGLLAAGVTTGIAFAVATIVPIQAPATQIDGRYFGMHLCQEYVPSWAWNCDAFKSSAEIQTDLSYSIAGLTPPPIPVDRWLASQGVGAEVAAREQIAGWSVFGAFVLAFILRGRKSGWKLARGERQLSGVKLQLVPDGARVANKLLGKDMNARKGKRIRLAPGVWLPRERELKGILAIGLPGAGKTQIITYLLDQWIKRGDTKLIIVDAGKGDFISKYPNDRFYLIAPHDDRVSAHSGSILNFGWNIGADICNPQRALGLATRLIVETNEPHWSEGSRTILQGILVGLQMRAEITGLPWGWGELYDALKMSDAEINAWMKKYWPLGAKLTATDKSGNANKTAACYETSVIVACATLVEPLQRAWRDLPASRLISLNEWMKNDNPDRQTIILGASGDYDVATGKLIGVLFRLMKGIMTSATFAESFDRRLLFVVDELSVFAAKGDPIASIKEFGRSKGIGLVIGIQNWAQLKKEYDTDGVANLQSLFELQILVCHAQTLSDDDGSGALAAKYIGKGSFVRWVGTTGKNANRSQKDEERLVVEPGYFTSELGSKPGDKIRAAVLIKNNLCTLDWPIMKSWVPRRVACKDAAWISTPTAEELERAAGTSTY